MKKLIAVAALSLLIVAQTFAGGPKIKITSGKLADLKGSETILLAYDYSKMAVGKFKSEEDYLKKKSDEYNKKEPGRGDRWKESWSADRASRFEPKFEELLNDNWKGVNCSKNNSTAKYTMTVKTTFTEPGYNVVVSRAPSMINLEITITETAGGKQVGKLTLTGSPGNSFGGYDYDTGQRISEAYAKAGKELGKFMAKNLKK